MLRILSTAHTCNAARLLTEIIEIFLEASRSLRVSHVYIFCSVAECVYTFLLQQQSVSTISIQMVICLHSIFYERIWLNILFVDFSYFSLSLYLSLSFCRVQLHQHAFTVSYLVSVHVSKQNICWCLHATSEYIKMIFSVFCSLLLIRLERMFYMLWHSSGLRSWANNMHSSDVWISQHKLANNLFNADKS